MNIALSIVLYSEQSILILPIYLHCRTIYSSLHGPKKRRIMKFREGLIEVATLALGLLSVASVIAVGEQSWVGATTRAEGVGFDALAHELFGADTCVPAKGSDADIAALGSRAVQ
jgi:hypothetical protein